MTKDANRNPNSPSRAALGSGPLRFPIEYISDEVLRVTCPGCGESIESDNYATRVVFREKHVACPPNIELRRAGHLSTDKQIGATPRRLK
jgi:hypothetical protein